MSKVYTQAEVDAIVAEKLKAMSKPRTSFNTSDAGYVELYGLPGKGRFSISLTPEGWDAVWALQADIQDYVKANRALCDARLQVYRATNKRAVS